MCSDLGRRAPKKRQLTQGHHGPDFATERTDYEVSCFATALPHVDMRIGIVAHDGVSSGYTQRRMVAMQIVRDHDRPIGTDQFAHRLYEVAVAVVDAIDHHCSMQIE